MSASMSTVVTCPPGPTSSAINAALQPPEPISKHRIPGVRCACSSMIACTYGADTELIVAPRASYLTRTWWYGRYACSRGTSGVNRCRGTARNAAATCGEVMHPAAMR